MKLRIPFFTAILSAVACLSLAGFIFGQTPNPVSVNAKSDGKRPPFLAGTVMELDTTASTITIAPQAGGASQVIRVNPSTQIAEQREQQVSDLKVGDQMQVTGIPTSMTASQLTVGQTSNQLSGQLSGLFAQINGKPGQKNSNPAPNSPAFAAATGRVFSTDPLIIAVTDDTFVTLKLAQNAKIARVQPISLGSIRLGDFLVASGQFSDDGSFRANNLAVNPDPGGQGHALAK